MQELKAPQHIQRPGLFSDAQATKMLNKSIREAEKHVKRLKSRLTRAIENPAAYDPVYQACQRIFHKSDDLVLTRQDKLRYQIRRRALRRFLHGCPPRKKNDTSIGDAFNWEWMVHCASQDNAELVIVSRDSDYGLVFGETAYVNDHLRQEFSERVSKKRKLLLYTRLSGALKHFDVPVSKQQEEAESQLVTKVPEPPPTLKGITGLETLYGLSSVPGTNLPTNYYGSLGITPTALESLQSLYASPMQNYLKILDGLKPIPNLAELADLLAPKKAGSGEDNKNQ
jgi:hypothetical protein